MNNLKLGFDKVYVISLPKRQDRRERVNRLLNGIDFEFIDAIDGYKDIDIQELIKTEALSAYTTTSPSSNLLNASCMI